jgi:hypothetical protein
MPRYLMHVPIRCQKSALRLVKKTFQTFSNECMTHPHYKKSCRSIEKFRVLMTAFPKLPSLHESSLQPGSCACTLDPPFRRPQHQSCNLYLSFNSSATSPNHFFIPPEQRKRYEALEDGIVALQSVTGTVSFSMRCFISSQITATASYYKKAIWPSTYHS